MDSLQLHALLKAQAIACVSARPLKADRPHLGFEVIVDGAFALPAWKSLRALVSSTGYSPFLIGKDTVPFMKSDWTPPRDVEVTETIAKGLACDVPAWLAGRIDEIASDREVGDDLDLEIAGDSGWNQQRPADELPYAVATGPQRKRPRDRVPIILFPTKNSFEIPALLPFGGWNACPDPDVQVALLRSWRDRYGAELLSIAGDVLECHVDRPPTTRDEAMRLAAEHYAFCEDVVDQGTMTMEALAASLLGNPLWFFWWD